VRVRWRSAATRSYCGLPLEAKGSGSGLKCPTSVLSGLGFLRAPRLRLQVAQAKSVSEDARAAEGPRRPLPAVTKEGAETEMRHLIGT
jgi:hypothetical protein